MRKLYLVQCVVPMKDADGKDKPLIVECLVRGSRHKAEHYFAKVFIKSNIATELDIMRIARGGGDIVDLTAKQTNDSQTGIEDVLGVNQNV